MLFSGQKAKDRLLKGPLCSYSGCITFAFKFPEQAHSEMSVMCVWSFFPSWNGSILDARGEMCHLCAAAAIYRLLGVIQLSEKGTTHEYICGGLGKSAGSLDTNRMSLVEQGAPDCDWDSLMTPQRGEGGGEGVLWPWDPKTRLHAEWRKKMHGDRETDREWWLNREGWIVDDSRQPVSQSLAEGCGLN